MEDDIEILKVEYLGNHGEILLIFYPREAFHNKSLVKSRIFPDKGGSTLFW